MTTTGPLDTPMTAFCILRDHMKKAGLSDREASRRASLALSELKSWYELEPRETA